MQKPIIFLYFEHNHFDYFLSILRITRPCSILFPVNYLVNLKIKPGDQFKFKYHKMRKTILIVVLMAVVGAVFSSCATYRNSEKSGCSVTKGFVGYR